MILNNEWGDQNQNQNIIDLMKKYKKKSLDTKINQKIRYQKIKILDLLIKEEMKRYAKMKKI